MRVPTITKTVLVSCLLSIIGFAHAELEIIPLRHRTVDQVLPVLQPLVEPGGVLTGQNNQLIVRTSARNLEEIRRALASIDTPQRRLMISVRFDSNARARDQAIDVRGTVRSGDVTISNRPLPSNQSNVTIGARSGHSNASEQVDQRIQVLEGGHAFIATGESRPVRQGIVTVTPSGRTVTQGTEFQDASTGFEVVPRVSGDRVTLDIAPQRETFGRSVGRRGASTVQGQRAATTVSGRLGEWFEIGGIDETADRSASGIGSRSAASATSGRRIWVRVDEVDR
jgi:type II secretory pathway component GspD/PulD (secretin)